MSVADRFGPREPAVPPGPVRRASLDDAARLARLFAAAFARDPVMDWLTRTGPARALALQRFFYWVLRERALPHGETWMTADGFSAAAWIPPYPDGRPNSFADEIRVLPVIWALTGLSRLTRGAAIASAMDQAHPKEPYFYLAFLGVAPRLQGAGMGSRLLETTLKRVDAAGAPAFLENSHPRNLKLYERAGFSVVREVRARREAPPLYAMWRPARPSAPQGSSSLSQ